jgi:O-antigen ligase
MSMFRDFPVFGTGLGTFKYAYFLYGKEGSKWVTHAHNDYLENLADTGLLGFAVLSLLLLLLTFSLLRMWSARRHPEIKPVVLGVLVALFAAAFHSLFDFSLRIPANAFLLIMLLALGLKVVTHKREFIDAKK